MARPRVFVSSTFYDLKHIRASLEIFIESLGFDAILFEKGDISFHPDAALDESCYREAASADIFVLIIGGRYGSQVSSASKADPNNPGSYESITRKEFETAQAADVPTFILLDNSVSSEYQTYLRNRDNNAIKYAHVDSIGVFRLIESIFERSRNNPVFNFERASQIENWLREQWAGLFRELLRGRSQQKQLSALNSQITELKSVNDTLKTYLEEVLTTVTPGKSDKLIENEENKLQKVRQDIALDQNDFFRHLKRSGIAEDDIRQLIELPSHADEAISKIERALNAARDTTDHTTVLRNNRAAQRDFNAARLFLGVDPLDFSRSIFAQGVDSHLLKVDSAVDGTARNRKEMRDRLIAGIVDSTDTVANESSKRKKQPPGESLTSGDTSTDT